MDLETLCKMLALDSDVVDAVLAYNATFNYEEMKDMCKKLYARDTWEAGVHELESYCGEDTYGMKILTVYLHCLIDTYSNYKNMGIPDKIFWDTMGFIPRFTTSHKHAYGVSAFRLAWWFPRQISMQLFRIGEYEYEFVTEDGCNKISLHIPSDANLDHGYIPQIYPFVHTYFPQYSDAMIICDSWLLAPALSEVLTDTSRILNFQKQFCIESIVEDSPEVLNWVFQSPEIPYEQLPENTSLQRNLKRYLIDGRKIGTAKGVYQNLSII